MAALLGAFLIYEFAIGNYTAWIALINKKTQSQ